MLCCFPDTMKCLDIAEAKKRASDFKVKGTAMATMIEGKLAALFPDIFRQEKMKGTAVFTSLYYFTLLMHKVSSLTTCSMHYLLWY